MTLCKDGEDFSINILNFKRLSGYMLWDADFPRTASMKIKRFALAEDIRNRFDRQAALKEL